MATARASKQTHGTPILRLRDNHEISDAPICRVQGFLNPATLLTLFEATDLTANPRLPRVNEQVRDMWRAIEEDPSTFHYKNNGILIAASSCEPLERGRYRVKFDPSNQEEHPRGILNGGHTTLASITALVTTAAEIHNEPVPRFGLWEQFREEIWPTWRERVVEGIDATEEFLVPVEILFPAAGQIDQYDALIHDIADARNNNCELTEETKDHHAGFYNELKAAIPDDSIRQQIEWRTNDGGRIKARDVVALASIPLSVICQQIVGIKFDLKHCYNSTARCSAFFHEIYHSVARSRAAQYFLDDDEKGKLVASAIALTGQLVEVYDWLQVEFPNAYNDAGGHFGGIKSVKSKGKKHPHGWSSRYRNRALDYSYSDGFFMPILTSLTVLITRKGDQLVWAEEPQAFLERHLPRIMKTFKPLIQDKDFDGRLVGRDPVAYQVVFENISMLHELESLQRQAT